MTRIVLALALWMALPAPAQAYSCSEVRAYVARYGARLALILARANGLTAVQERAARSCLSRQRSARRR